MKKVIIYACIGLVVVVLGIGIVWLKKTQNVDKKETLAALDSSDIKDMPVLKFAENKYDFGTIRKEDTPVNIAFEYQNEGEAPLIIQKVDVSCGCLSAEYSKQPTKPNEKGRIKVKIDIQDATDSFNKTLFVKSNATEDVILLRIIGQIK